MSSRTAEPAGLDEVERDARRRAHLAALPPPEVPAALVLASDRIVKSHRHLARELTYHGDRSGALYVFTNGGHGWKLARRPQGPAPALETAHSGGDEGPGLSPGG